MKYSDLMADWLVELGYTHCFFLAGGNIMHLLESCSRKFTCIPVIHEVAAGIAVEYFNEISEGARAFALVTAGPGLTNIVTAMAGAYLDSRELLVLGGQVKVADLARGQVRQRGIQEVDGVDIAKPVTVRSTLVERVIDQETFVAWSQDGSHGRKGPVFLELPLDIQAAPVDETKLNRSGSAAANVPKSAEQAGAKLAAADSGASTDSGAEMSPDAGTVAGYGAPSLPAQAIATVQEWLAKASRPVVLIGGGISRATVAKALPGLEKLGVPLMTTWNGFDRLPADYPFYFGRPNTWGQRSANILLQQADLVIALGTRLGLQQSGFNWQNFVPVGKVVQVEIDPRELAKGHPRVDLPVNGDANAMLLRLAEGKAGNYAEWVEFCRMVRREIPLNDPKNETAEGFLSPYELNEKLSAICTGEDVVIPCSSGGANTVAMQAWQVKRGQRGFNSKSLASMGYGLSGSIGAAIAMRPRRTILMEGDGGFTQNLQELGTVRQQKLNLKIFINDDHGYASIRMTQSSYFGGRYVGCDVETGLGMPEWSHLFAAYSIPVKYIGRGFENDPEFLELFHGEGASAFIVKIDPKQTYFPKITSRVTESGGMESNPLHKMTPELSPELSAKVFRYLSV